MPWCHDCNAEYPEELTRCTRCGATLLSEPPPEIQTATGKWAYREMAYLCDADTPIGADSIQACLRAEDIPSLIRPRGGSRYPSAIMGFPQGGVDLYVPAEKLDEAKRLLEEFDAQEEQPGDEAEKLAETGLPDGESDELERLQIRRRRMMVVFTWILVIIFVLFVRFRL